MNTSNDTTPKPGQKVAHYHIIRKIGQGGMSIVYEGLDEKLKRPVAIKILHPFLASNEEYRSRFLREAQAVARLSHPNILQIFDVATVSNEQLYIVTELLDGETLADFSKVVHFSQYPELSAMVIFHVAEALMHAHQKGIIHRDIKPENIMVLKNGQIKLMDFGIASLGSEDSITQSGTLMGSLAHLAPEVIKGQKALVQSDIFSLSTVFFWMLTDELPFKGSSPHALLKAIVDTNPKKVQSLSPYITDDIALVVERGMKKDPDARFKNFEEFCNAIETALSKMGLSIDKNLQAVLKSPSELPVFQKRLLEKVEQQIEIYQKQNDQAGVLALECRIKASPKPKKSHKRKFLLALALPVIAAVFFLWPTQKPVVEVQAPKPLVAEPEVFIKEEVQVIEEEKVLEEAPKIEPVLKASMEVLEVIIWPYADVTVDGRLLAKRTKHFKIGLKPGKHKFVFTHNYAATVEKIIDSPTGEEMIKVELVKSKPAFLVVHSDTDADVAIEKSFKGSSSHSLKKPIVIPMPDKTQSQVKEIIISQDGFKPHIIKAEFIAGQTTHVKVDLKKAE